MTDEPPKILVVEDENVVALDLRRNLGRLGYRVLATVDSAEQALESVARQRPDLVLMDIHLRGQMDGIQAAERMAQVDIPVIYLTAFSDEGTLQRARLTEPFGYLLKPFDDRELHIIIELALHRHRAQKERDLRLREQAARMAVEREHRWSQFLARTSLELSASLDLKRTLDAIGRLAVPALADWAIVRARGEPGPEILALHHASGNEDLARELLRRYPAQPDAPHGSGRVLRTGQPELIAEIKDDMLRATASSEEHLELLRALGLRAQMCVPLRARGETWGTLTLASSESGRTYDREDLAHAMELAGRCSSAIDNARLYEESVRATRERDGLIEGLARTVHFSELFVGMLGHDLRNPLSAITSTATLLTVAADPARIVQRANRILSSGSRMARMIDQLLDFTQIRLGKGIPLQPVSVDLRRLCEEVIEELDLAQVRNIRLETVGDVAGRWDRDRLFQLLSNLFGNALQHGKGGALVCLDGKDAASVVVQVHNPGAIPPHILPVIFEPMKRSHDRKQVGSSGLGLGLQHQPSNRRRTRRLDRGNLVRGRGNALRHPARAKAGRLPETTRPAGDPAP